MDLTMPPTAGSDRSARERERLLARDRPAVRSWSRSTPLDSQPVLIFLGECSLLNLFLYSFISIRVITYEISCTSIRCIMSTHGVGLFARLAGCTDLVTSPTDVLPSFHAHACAIHQLNNTKPKTLKTQYVRVKNQIDRQSSTAIYNLHHDGWVTYRYSRNGNTFDFQVFTEYMHASQLAIYVFLPAIVPHVANYGVATVSSSSFQKQLVLYFPFFESVPTDQITRTHEMRN